MLMFMGCWASRGIDNLLSFGAIQMDGPLCGVS